MNARARGGAQSGAALVLALVFVSAFGFIGLAALDTADASFRADRGGQTSRSNLAAANGALDVLITAMRGDASWGRAGAPCNGAASGDVQVSCAPAQGSGALLVGGFGARADRIVDLVASIGDERVARARVELIDGGGSSPGAAVRVRNWTTSR